MINDDGRSCICECNGNGCADTRTRPGYDRDLSFQQCIHFNPLGIRQVQSVNSNLRRAVTIVIGGGFDHTLSSSCSTARVFYRAIQYCLWTFIDWDNAVPGTRLWDLAWATISFPPVAPSSDLSVSYNHLRDCRRLSVGTLRVREFAMSHG
jgi:hypothetical protein